MDTWQAVDEERGALADDLAGLDDAQWDAPSLCDQWRVRHVVAHLTGGADVRMGPFLVGMVRSGFNFNRTMAREALAAGAAPPDELLARFRATVGVHRTPLGAKPGITLLDLVCHAADVRRPLGLTRLVPQPTLVAAADTAKGIGLPLHAKRRIAGLRLSATDAEWATGDGPSVTGPLASLILVMAGRRAALDDLAGEGLETLGNRL